MSLDRLDVVDAVGTERDGTVVLSIIDGWDWSDESRHLHALQDKINVYFGCIESEQLFEEYPTARDAPLRIDVLTRLPIPDPAKALIEEADAVARQLHTSVRHVQAPT